MGLDSMSLGLDMPSYVENENGKNLLRKVFVFLGFITFLLLSSNIFACNQINDFQWKEIREKKLSGKYRSPFSNDCFYLFLKKSDYKYLLTINNNKIMKENLNNDLHQYLYFNIKENNNFYFLKYTVHTKKEKIENKRKHLKYLLRYEKDLFFFHELYHLHPSMLFSYDITIKEFNSDIAALIHLSIEYKLNKEELYLLSKDLYYFRKQEDLISNTHFNEKKWQRWLLKLEKMENLIYYKTMNEIINSVRCI